MILFVGLTFEFILETAHMCAPSMDVTRNSPNRQISNLTFSHTLKPSKFASKFTASSLSNDDFIFLDEKTPAAVMLFSNNQLSLNMKRWKEVRNI